MTAHFIIPHPASVELSGQNLRISGGLMLDAAAELDISPDLARHIICGRRNILPQLKLAGGAVGSIPGATRLALRVCAKTEHPEAYGLVISPEGIEISAASRVGALHGLNTLAQLILTGEKALDEGAELALPCLCISDRPRFGWRGMHLDVSRHFMPVPFIKKFIDLLALYKYNILHWHLTDDQGWRVEIKAFPKLAAIASVRPQTLVYHMNGRRDEFDGVAHSGYYTQEQIREVVAYALDRGVEIVPEIDMPGHMQAALTAYPEWGNTGKAPGVRTVWGISEHILNMEDSTVAAMKTILAEVMELFPCRYIHIGGDEAIKDQWKASPAIQEKIRKFGLKDEEELQDWFIRQVGDFINEKGRVMVGWDEILNPHMPRDSVIMSWRNDQGAIKAARQGCPAINTDSRIVYFDHYQADPAREPLAICGFTTTRRVYEEYEPVPAELSPQEAQLVRGGQGQLWTEYMKDQMQVEYMAFPRACALAERLWSERERRDWAGFAGRLAAHLPVLGAHNVN